MQPLPAPPREPGTSTDHSPTRIRPERVGGLTDEELNQRISFGWEEWTELQDALLATGGTLPLPDVAARATVFFASTYPQATQAYREALRRQFNRGPQSRQADSQRGMELA